ADPYVAPTLVPESAAVIAEDPAAPLLDLPAPMADVEVASAFDSPPASTEPVSVSPTVVPSIELTAAAEAETPTQEHVASPAEDATRSPAQETIAALDQWLDAIHVARAQRRA